MTEQRPGDLSVTAGAPARTIMPPHVVQRGFLDLDTAASLLEFTIAHEPDFAPTRTGYGKNSGTRPDLRISTGTRELGPFKPILKDGLRALLPGFVEKLQVTPIDNPKIELELVAHNDGAFFKRHIDTQTASNMDHIRVLSAVYYFHGAPKGFTGGALRLYAIGDPKCDTFVDIDPEHNTLLVFPAWAPHEVMPIGCPSKRFADSRFAVNCWVHRHAEAASSRSAGP